MSASSLAYEYCQRLMHRISESRKTFLSRTSHRNKVHRPAGVASCESLENRILLSGNELTTAYVNDDWASLTVGVDPDGDGPATEFGYDAFATIQEAIDNMAIGGTVRVGDGTYNENITINQSLTLISDNGRDVTFINGISGVGAQGTITISNAVSNVYIGGYNDVGFTILGIDNGDAAQANAAIYIQAGNHDQLRIYENEIVANGDYGLYVETDNTYLRGTVFRLNIFSGQTFIGDTPAGNDLTQQDTLANVPRSLVSLGNGTNTISSYGNMMMLNTFNGITGGINNLGFEQGNDLITIASTGGFNFALNTFDGTVMGGRSSVQIAQSMPYFDRNTFLSDSMGSHTAHINYTQITKKIQEIDLISRYNNTFDRGAYITGLGGITTGISDFVEYAPSDSVINVLPGTYDADMTVWNDNITVIGPNAWIPLSASSFGPQAVINGGFDVRGDNFNLNGVTITNGIKSNGVGNFSAVHLASDTTGHTIQYNVITGNDDPGSVGVYLHDSVTDSQVGGNDISMWYRGITAVSGSDNSILHNTIHDNTYGIYAESINSTTFQNNALNDNDVTHIDLYNIGSDNIVYKNSFDTNSDLIRNSFGQNIDASFNWWGTIDIDLIASKQKSIATGTIDYSPILTSVENYSFLSDNFPYSGYGFYPKHFGIIVHTSGSQQTDLIDEVLNTTTNIRDISLQGDFTGNYTIDNSIILGGEFSLDGSLTFTNGTTLAPGYSPAIVNIGDLSMAAGSTLIIEAFGTTPGTEHDQVNVTGTVDITDTILNLQLGYVPANGDSILLLNNDESDPITGHFLGLPEGTVFKASYDNSDYTLQISYVGGDGNDITLDVLTTTNPVAQEVVTSTNQATNITASFNATDEFANSVLTYVIVDNIAANSGTLSNNGDGTFTFNPNGDFDALSQDQQQAVTFTYKATNQYNLESNVATVTITVTGINDLPVATNSDVDTDEETSITGNFVGSDVDINDTLSFTIIDNPTAGTVTNNNNGTFTFNPGYDFSYLQENETANVSFMFKATDNHNSDSQLATVKMTVTGLVNNVSNVYVDDNWFNLPVGVDPDGIGPATAMGYDAFATLQKALDNTAIDGTLYIADGTYNNNIYAHTPINIHGTFTVNGDFQFSKSAQLFTNNSQKTIITGNLQISKAYNDVFEQIIPYGTRSYSNIYYSFPSVSNGGLFVVYSNTYQFNSRTFIYNTVTKEHAIIPLPEGATYSTNESFGSTISADGTLVTFTTRVPNNSTTNIDRLAVYCYNTQTQELELVSKTSTGQIILNDCWQSTISADGRFIAYVKRPYQSEIYSQIYVYDRITGITECVSRNDAGVVANSNCSEPSISANGQYITFKSYARNLENNSLGRTNLYVYDRYNDTLQYVSNTDTTPSTYHTEKDSAISADGRFTAFETFVKPLVDNDNNSVSDIFLYDNLTNTIKCISRGISGDTANGASIDPSISSDGRYIVYLSLATDIVNIEDNSNSYNTFVYDQETGQTQIILPMGLLGNSIEYNPSISPDGKSIVFVSASSNWIEGDTSSTSEIYRVSNPFTNSSPGKLSIKFLDSRTTNNNEILNVTGLVKITDATLDLTLYYYPSSAGDSFTIINNDDTDAIVGIFAGLAEGASFTLSYGGVDFNASITYVGGDGNDVVITTNAYALPDVYVDDDWASLAIGDDPDGNGPAKALGFDAFSTIQEALTAVDTDGTVSVADGNYIGDVHVDSGITLVGSFTLNGALTVDGGANLLQKTGVNIIHTGDLIMGLPSTLYVQINGPTPGTEMSQIDVTGTVDVSNATFDFLSIDLNYLPDIDEQLIIISNDGADPVIGTFKGTPEGDLIRVTDNSSNQSFSFYITYVGGDGNDIALIRNSAPFALPVTINGTEDDTSITGNFDGDDVNADDDPSTLIYTIKKAPELGSVINNNDGTFTYLLEDDYLGLAEGETRQTTFEYWVQDSHSMSAFNTVTVTITGTNNAPVANTVTANTDEDHTVTANFDASDADTNDTLTYTIVDAPTLGSVINNNDGTFTFDPQDAFQYLAQGDSTQVTFTYKATDNHSGESNIATVTITVTGVNEAPVANTVTANTDEDHVVTANFDSSDVDTNDTLTYSIIDVPGAGSVINNNDGTFTFDPQDAFQYLAQGDSTQVTFTYKATDNHNGESNIATVTIIVIGANEAPVANTVTANTDEDHTVTANFDASDADTNDTLTYTIVDAPILGSVINNNDGTFTFDPQDAFQYLAQGESTQVTFTYKTSDNHSGESNIATVIITVTGTNDTPVANTVTANTDEDHNVTANFDASDIESSDTLTYTIVDVPTAGSVINNNDGTFTFDPQDVFRYLAQGDSTQVTFTYKATDNHSGESNIATVTITVTGNDKFSVYVDDDWAALNFGDDPDGFGPATAIGVDAFATITNGINAVNEGGTVHVNAGEYAENDIVIDKSISVIGEGSDVVRVNHFKQAYIYSAGFAPQADNITISGMSLENAVNAINVDNQNISNLSLSDLILQANTETGFGTRGVHIEDATVNNLNVDNVHFVDIYTGINVYQNATVNGMTITDSTFNVDFSGITASTYQSSVTDLTVTGSSFTGNTTAIDGKIFGNTLIDNNTFTENRTALSFTTDENDANDEGDEILIQNNTFTDQINSAIRISAVNDISPPRLDVPLTIQYNTITQNVTSSIYGAFPIQIFLGNYKAHEDINILENSITLTGVSQTSGQVAGIAVRGAMHNVNIERNTIDGGNVGTFDGNTATAGIELSTRFYLPGLAEFTGNMHSASHVNIANNFINHFDAALSIVLNTTSDGEQTDSYLPTGPQVIVNGNDLSGNVAILNAANFSINPVDFSGNYLGLTPPALPTHTSAADLTPYVINGTDTDLVTAGFQPDYSQLAVFSTSSQTSNIINEALSLVDANGKVYVMGGNYTENITLNNGVTLMGSFVMDGTLTVTDGGQLQPGNSPGLLNTGNLIMTTGSVLSIELDGTIAGSGYDQVNATGTIDISGATLDLSLNFLPDAGDSFTIIKNDGDSAVTGEFAGLAEGDSIILTDAIFNEEVILYISYVGGDGNDVVLTVNDAPVAQDIFINAIEDGIAVVGQFKGTDPFDTSLTYTLISTPSEGTVVNNNDGTFTFTPGSDFQDLSVGQTRNVTFTYIATDGSGMDSGQGTVTVTVTGVNDTPVSNYVSANTDEDSNVTGNFDSSDIDSNDTWSYSIVDQPAMGTVINNNDGTFTFKPNNDLQYLAQGESTDVTFTYKATDNHTGESSTATVTITVVGANDRPVSNSVNMTTDEETPILITLDGSDVDATDILTYHISQLPTYGQLTNNNDGTFTFTPSGIFFQNIAQDESRVVTFQYHVKDQHGFFSDSDLVRITVTGINDNPQVTNINGQINEYSTYTDSFIGSDVDTNDTLTYTIVDAPSAGIVTNHNDGTFTYDPQDAFRHLTNGESEQVTFTYQATDNHNGQSNLATVTLTIDGYDNFVIYVDDDWAGLDNGVDPDADGPAYAIGVDAFATITDAINAVSDQGLIYVADGFYTEHDISINQSMTIVGNGSQTVIVELANNTGFLPTVDNIAISGMTLQNATTAILLDNADSPVSNLSLDDVSFYHSSSKDILIAAGSTVENLRITNSTFTGTRFSDGIRFMPTAVGNGVTIYNTTFENHSSGVVQTNIANNKTTTGYITNLQITNSTFKKNGFAAIYGHELSNILIDNNTFTENGNGFGFIRNVSTQIESIQTGNFTITNNTFTDHSNAAVNIQGYSGIPLPITIQGNTINQDVSVFYNTDSAIQIRLNDYSENGKVDIIENSITYSGEHDAMPTVHGIVLRGALNNVNIQRNTIDGGNVGTIDDAITSSSILIFSNNDLRFNDNNLYGADHISISNNFIRNFDAVLSVYDEINAVYGGMNAKSTVTLFNNNLSGNVTGIQYGDGSTLDASGNWWGSTDVATVAAMMTGNVDFSPFLESGTDTSTTTGFQGDFSALTVHTQGAQQQKLLQEAVEIADWGADIHVDAGMYTTDYSYVVYGEDVPPLTIEVESLYVNKFVHLLGANAGIDPNTQTRGDESIITGSVLFGAPGIVFDGFEVTGDSTEYTYSNSPWEHTLWGKLINIADRTQYRNLIIHDTTHGGGIEFVTGNSVTISNSYLGTGVGFYKDSDKTTSVSWSATITDNVFDGSGIGTSGQYSAYYSLGLTATNNQFGSGGIYAESLGGLIDGNTFDHGKIIMTGSATISNNYFANNSYIILGLDDPYWQSAMASANITGNVFEFNTDVNSTHETISIMREPNASNIHINGNSFINGHANADVNLIINRSAESYDGRNILDLSTNWFSTTDINEILDLTYNPIEGEPFYPGLVDISTFLASGTDADLNTPGFQADLSHLYVHDQGAQTTGLIAEALSLVTTGGMITVLPGTYDDTINISNGITLNGSFTTTGIIAIAAGGTLSPGNSPGIIQANGLQLSTDSTLQLELKGTEAGTGYDQIIVNGAVTLANANLDLSLNFNAQPGDSFLIIDNDGSDEINSTFAGLAEGAVLVVNDTVSGENILLSISYVGGDGNDVVLTAIDGLVANNVAINAVEDGPAVNGSFSGNDPLGHGLTYTITSTPSTGTVINNHDGTFTFDPGNHFQNLAQGQTQDVTFTYTATNQSGTQSKSATVTVTVTGTNDSPSPFGGGGGMYESQSKLFIIPVYDVDLSDVMTFTLVSGPTQGQITEFGNYDATHLQFRYELGDAFQYLAEGQSDQVLYFNFTADDNHGGVANGTLSVTIWGENDVPVVENITANVKIDATLTLDFAGYDVDTADSITYSIIDTPVAGSLINNNDGTFTFDPDSDFIGLGSGETQTVTFTYKATDSHNADSNIATVSITVTGSSAPESNHVQLNATENGPAVIGNFLASGGTGVLTYQLVDLPVQGNVINNNDGTFTYTPGDFINLNTGESQIVTFTYKAIDATNVDSNLSTVTITVAGVTETHTGPNGYPNAAVDNAYTNSGQAIDINVIANDSDPDGDTLHVVSAHAVSALGVPVTINSDGTIHYDPSGYFTDKPVGQTLLDYFKYEAQDPYGHMDQTRVNVWVTVVQDVNDAPVAQNVTGNAQEDGQPVTISFNADDVDGDDTPATLTYTLLSTPAEGTVINNNDGSFTFDPGNAFQDLNTNQSRNVTFTYMATDSHGVNSNTATVTITVAGADELEPEENVAPTASNVSVNINEHSTPTSFNFNADDTNTDDTPSTLIYTLLTTPSQGTVTNNHDGTFTYDIGSMSNLNPGQTQVVTFTYRVTDSHGVDSNTATVTMTINGVNDNPVADNVSGSTDEDSTVTLNFSASDVDTADALTYSIVSQPSAGQVINHNNGTFTFEPQNALQYLSEGESTSITFTYRAIDNHAGQSNVATVTITVTGSNDTPAATNVADTTDKTSTVTASFSGSDPDTTDTLSYSIVDTPTSGSVINNNDGTFTFDPGSDFDDLTDGQSREVTFTYKSMDQHGLESSLATVTITVTSTPENQAPIAQHVITNVPEDGPYVTVSFNADDADSDDTPASLTYQILSLPGKGILTNNNDGTFSYDPHGAFENLTLGQSQNVTFTYQAVDSHGAVSNTATVTLTIDGANDTTPTNNQYPNAAVDIFNTKSDTVINLTVLNNDSDPDGDALRVQSLETPTSEKGVPLTINADGTIAYDPTGHFDDVEVGTIYRDTFRYVISDPYGHVDATRVFIYVTRVESTTPNESPVAGAVTGSLLEDDPSLTLSFVGSDADDSLANLTYHLTSIPAKGSVINNGNGTFTFTPGSDFQSLNTGQSQTVTFTYNITDPHGATSNTATVTLTVHGEDDVINVNTAPVAQNVTGNATEDGSPVTLAFNADDADSDDSSSTLTYTLLSTPSEGSVINNNDGTFTFNPGSDFQDLNDGQSRDVTFTYKATDSHNADSNTATITMTVYGVTDVTGGNQAPVAQNVTGHAMEDGGNVTVSFNADDADPDDTPATLTYTLISTPTEGTVINNNNGSFTFKPGSGFQDLGVGETRSITFTYKVTDSHGADSNTATVTITVQGKNDYPSGAPNLAQTTQNTAINIDVLGNDHDVDGDTLTTSGVDATSVMGVPLSVNPDGTIHYDPTGYFDHLAVGTTVRDSFRYDLTDPYGAQDRTRVFVDVTAIAVSTASLSGGTLNFASSAPTVVANHLGNTMLNLNSVNTAALAWASHQASLKPVLHTSRLSNHITLGDSDDDATGNTLKLTLVDESLTTD